MSAVLFSIRTQTHNWTNTHTHARTHARTHLHTHIYTHSVSLCISLSLCLCLCVSVSLILERYYNILCIYFRSWLVHFLHSNISNLYTLCVCIVHCLIRFIVLTPLQMGLWPYWIKFPYSVFSLSLFVSRSASLSLLKIKVVSMVGVCGILFSVNKQLHARTHARTHTKNSHTQTHARTHARTHTYPTICINDSPLCFSRSVYPSRSACHCSTFLSPSLRLHYSLSSFYLAVSSKMDSFLTLFVSVEGEGEGVSEDAQVVLSRLCVCGKLIWVWQ